MRILEPDAFIPPQWNAIAYGGPVRMFNPGLIRHGGRRIFAFRLVLADGHRRIAICALDDADRPVARTIVPLSDLLPQAGPWQADPRLFAIGDRLFVHFNDGDRARPNAIFIAELDPQTLTPLGGARPLKRIGSRRAVEKNWMLFSPDDATALAVYSIHPHRMLAVDLAGSEAVACRDIAQIEWSEPSPRHGLGEPRGGTTPVRVGDTWYAFFHMHGPAPFAAQLLHALRRRLRGRGGRPLHRYHMGFYGFSVHPPYRPICFTPMPVIETPPRLRCSAPALNPDAERVLYPTGALYDDGRWTVAAGLHDDRCCMLKFDHAALLARAEAVR